MKKLKLLLASTFMMLFALTPVVAVAQNDITSGLCNGANLSANSDGNCDPDRDAAADNIQTLVTNIINIFSWVVGVISVIMIIVGGFKYITSGGDASGVTSAKNTILYAIVGLIVVALAQIVVKFVIGTIGNATG